MFLAMEWFILLFFILGVVVRLFLPGLMKYRKYLNKYLIYIGIPLLVFVSVTQKEIPFLKYLLFSITVAVIYILILYFIISKLKLGAEDKAAAFMCSAFGNTAYFGIPFAYLLFGEIGGIVASIFTVVLVALHLTLGLFLANTYLQKRTAVKKLLKQPFFWILIATLIISRYDFSIPSIVGDIAHVGTYIALFVIGTSLAWDYINKKTFGLSLFKFVVPPVVMAPFFFIFNISEYLPFLLMALTPSAFLNTVLAIEFDFNDELSSGITTINSIIFMIGVAILMVFFTT